MAKTYLDPQTIVEHVVPIANTRLGLLAPSNEILQPAGNADMCVFTTNVSRIDRIGAGLSSQDLEPMPIAGAGVSTNRRIAHAKSYCEGIERYCNVLPADERMVVASRDQLGDAALDLTLFPHCSEAEYNHPTCIIQKPNNSLPMRWVQGFSLIDGRPLFVPATAIYVGLQIAYVGENFTTQISTGTALAASYEQAAIAAICEVIERDALTLTWLHRLPLPRLDLDSCPDPAFQERRRRAEAAGLELHMFDATTDLGVATAYLLQIAPHGPVQRLVLSATRLNPFDLPGKVLDEAASSRLAVEQQLRQPRPFNPERFDTFNRFTDGAIFYAEARNAPEAFDFLLQSTETRPFAALPDLRGASPAEELARLIDIFRSRGLELAIIDLTLPALRELGMFVVKVIAPQLMPLSGDHNARFLATPRLYEAPVAMGYGPRSEADINPYPQPFA